MKNIVPLAALLVMPLVTSVVPKTPPKAPRINKAALKKTAPAILAQLKEQKDTLTDAVLVVPFTAKQAKTFRIFYDDATNKKMAAHLADSSNEHLFIQTKNGTTKKTFIFGQKKGDGLFEEKDLIFREKLFEAPLAPMPVGSLVYYSMREFTENGGALSHCEAEKTYTTPTATPRRDTEITDGYLGLK